MIDNIIDHIQIAIEEAYKREIKVNTIIIDREIAYMNHFYINTGIGYGEVPDAIFGLRVVYANLKPYDANFVLLERKESEQKELQDYTNEELLQELLRREQE